jgi:hypothetical protein
MHRFLGPSRLSSRVVHAEPDPLDPDAVRDRTEALARSLVDRFPWVTHYPLVLRLLADTRTAASSGPLATFESARPLGVLVAREFEDAKDDAAALAVTLGSVRVVGAHLRCSCAWRADPRCAPDCVGDGEPAA